VNDYPDEMTFEYIINDNEIHIMWNKEELIQQIGFVLKIYDELQENT
jgi:hypothetical protein